MQARWIISAQLVLSRGARNGWPARALSGIGAVQVPVELGGRTVALPGVLLAGRRGLRRRGG